MIVQLSDKYRAESGPVRKEAVATTELLSNEVTAEHYQEGKFDAMGKTIKLGEKMTYLDYRNARCWYLYELGMLQRVRYDTVTGEKVVEEYEGWKPLGSYSVDEVVNAVTSKVPGFDVNSVNWAEV